MNGPVITVRDLSFVYPNGTEAVRGLNLSVLDGEVFGFLGPSGAGKTTTQRILIGLLTGWQGTVELFGQDLLAWKRDLYDRIGVAFEFPSGYRKLTARENLTHFAHLHGGEKREIPALLESVGLGHVLDRRIESFSKGMLTRLNLARALLHRPDLLFLDEPTAGLDPVTTRQVLEVISEANKRGATVFLISHDMEAADRLCDRVAFVVDGTITACGAPRDLRLQASRRILQVVYRVNGERREVELPLDQSSETLSNLLDSGTVETVHTAEATLDDVFVRVAGRSA